MSALDFILQIIQENIVNMQGKRAYEGFCEFAIAVSLYHAIVKILDNNSINSFENSWRNYKMKVPLLDDKLSCSEEEMHDILVCKQFCEQFGINAQNPISNIVYMLLRDIYYYQTIYLRVLQLHIERQEIDKKFKSNNALDVTKKYRKNSENLKDDLNRLSLHVKVKDSFYENVSFANLLMIDHTYLEKANLFIRQCKSCDSFFSPNATQKLYCSHECSNREKNTGFILHDMNCTYLYKKIYSRLKKRKDKSLSIEFKQEFDEKSHQYSVQEMLVWLEDCDQTKYKCVNRKKGQRSLDM